MGLQQVFSIRTAITVFLVLAGGSAAMSSEVTPRRKPALDGETQKAEPTREIQKWAGEQVPARKPGAPATKSDIAGNADKDGGDGGNAKKPDGAKKTAGGSGQSMQFARVMMPPLTKTTGKQIGQRQFKPIYSKAEALQCEAALKTLGVQYSVSEELDGSGDCGWERPVQVRGLPNGVKVHGDVKLRCEAALGLALWTKESVAPAAKEHLGTTLAGLDIGTSYHCRRRNGARTGKLSEHAFANGIDLMGFRFNPREPLKVTFQSGWKEKKFQKQIRDDLCKYFTTVLGPGTDAAHKDHFHFDLAVRRKGYRYCK